MKNQYKEAILRYFERLNASDPDLLEIFADDVRYVIPGDMPVSGTFHGKEQVMNMWFSVFEQLEYIKVHPEELIAEGKRLFNIACKSCHGVDGYGTPMAPALNNQIFLSETPDAAIYQIIAGGVPDTLMPAWGSRLNDQSLQALVAFLRSQEETAPPILPPILGD